MEKKAAAIFISFFLFSCALLSTGSVAEDNPGDSRQRGKLVRLFVFGDSYADTGNLPRQDSTSWRWPYGITFPGKPSGRFSDGRVLTDYIAKFLGIESPLPYNLIQKFDTNSTRNGINFAHGGTGIFETMVKYPNMSTQIDLFQQIIDQKVYPGRDLNTWVALVSLAGNDYSTFLAKNGSFKDLPDFSKSLIDHLMMNVRRLRSLGVKRIGITGLHPLGCLPVNTVSDAYRNCNGGENDFAESHNRLLKQNIQTLNKKASAPPIFVYLDLYNAFMSAINKKPEEASEKLKPCCMGAKGEECGLVDNEGKKRFDVCKNPIKSLFWDSIHPSDAAWMAVYSSLTPSLSSILLN